MQSYKSLSKFTLCFALALVSACDIAVVDKEKEDAKTTPTAVPVTSQAQEPEPVADYEIAALSEPNQYRIAFRSGIQARLNTTVTEDQKDQSQNFALGIYQGGKSYEFVIEENGEKNLVQIQIPEDLVLNEVLTAPESADWKISTSGRLFLQRDAVLTILDKNLVLEAAEIVSDSAQIQTFIDGTQAPAGQRGRDGGNILLKATKISGILSVFQRGENGGNGIPGAPYTEHAAASTINHGGGHRWAKGCLPQFYLGGRGADGQKGLAGGPGQRGGNSGDLILEITQQDDFKLTRESQPGAGGKPGPGGPGQPGGLGGKSGYAKDRPEVPPLKEHIEWGYVDCIAERGPNGNDGPQGDSGIPGNPGAEGRFCSLQDGQMQCE